MEFQGPMHCRLCDKNITGKKGLLLYDYNENVETQLGRKINIILNSDQDNKEILSNYCCEFCASKIEICFSLLVEIQASDEVIRQTYDNFTNGKRIDTTTQLYICGECQCTLSGIKSFIKHYENHILRNTIIGSKNDVSLCAAYKSESQTADVEFEEELLNNMNQEENNLPLFDNNALGTYAPTEVLVDSEEIANGNDLNDCDSKSVDSFQSDSSLKDLMNLAKVELVKSNDEDLFNVQPNANGNYTCDICKLTFEYKFVFQMHLKTNHQSYHDLDVFYIKNLLQSVQKDLEDDSYMKCRYCNQNFMMEELKSHVLSCVHNCKKNKKNILCQMCGQWFSFENLDKHMQGHKKTEYLSCEHCDKTFKTKKILISHLGEHDESKKKICEFCGEKFLPQVFFNHMAKHREKKHVCGICGKAFTYNYGLRLHLKVHENKVSEKKYEKKKDKVFCWLCKKVFDTTTSLNKHLKTDHNADGMEQDTRFSCEMCSKKFADMFSLKAHLKLIHEMRDEEIAQFKSLPIYRYIECNVCNKIFNSENKIRIHMKQDHGLKPFEMEILKKECEKCGKKFASKQNLIHHINSAHLHIKPMTCDICQEKFAKHSSLIYHKLRHSGEKPFQCEFCQKSYRQRNDVIRHLARHVRDKELTLEEASAINNSPSRLVMKRRIFLKDSSINYQTIVRKSRRKSEVVEMEPILEEEINEIQEEQMDFNEDVITESMIYVEEVPVDETQNENSSEIQYIDTKTVYNEEHNTIILSSPDVMNNSVKNVTYRYIPSQLKHMPAVIVKKQEQV